MKPKKLPDFDVILSRHVFVVTTEIKTRSYAFYAAIKNPGVHHG